MKKSDRALLLIDLTSERLVSLPENVRGDLLAHIRGELAYFRERSRPVIHVHSHVGETAHFAPRLREDTWHQPGPHAWTTRWPALQDRGIARVTLVGLGLRARLLPAAASALEARLGVTVPRPCVAAASEPDGEAVLRILHDVWCI